VSIAGNDIDSDPAGSTARPGKIDGNQVHDAGIAAVCLDAGVGESWSADRDFSR
jgi:predicted nucleic acid-binding protein